MSLRLGSFIVRWIAGCDGLQAAPVRSIKVEKIQRSIGRILRVLPIYLVENAWQEDASKWGPLDQRVFGNPKEARLRFLALKFAPSNPLVIDHQARSGTQLVEAHIGTGLTPRQLANTVRDTPARIVLDTWHIRRTFFYGTPPPGDLERLVASWSCWQDNLAALADYVKVVHFQPLRDGGRELRRWLKGKPTVLGDILEQILLQCPRVRYWVIELSPPNGTLRQLIWTLRYPRTLRRVRKKLRKKINQHK